MLPSLLQYYQCRSQGVVASCQWGLLSLCSGEGAVKWLVKQVEQHKTEPKLTRGFMQVTEEGETRHRRTIRDNKHCTGAYSHR